MKLQLVMLTTVISMITERQIEAQLICFENRNRTGRSETFKASRKDIASLFPNGPKACQIPPRTVIIFYSDVNYEGHENAIYSKTGKIYYPTFRFVFRSFFLLGQSSPDGVHLFKRRRFQGGSPTSFSKEDDNVTDGSPFLSAVVIGPDDWTIARNCKDKKCHTCLTADKQGGASFIQDIKNGVLEKVISVSRANCLGTKYIGRPSIPECPCNPHGVVDGPDKCEGTNGICKCRTNHTGDDCDSCEPHLTWREGKCVAGCGCFPPGVQDDDMTCPYKYCRCGQPYLGKLCDECVYWVAYKNYDGLCIRHSCEWTNTIMPIFAKYDGHCICKKNYIGNCDTCVNGYHKYGIKCLTGSQYDKVMDLQDMRDNDPKNATKLFSILDNLVTLGVLMSNTVADVKINVIDNLDFAFKVADTFLRYQYNWQV